jgi:hypothetical protein
MFITKSWDAFILPICATGEKIPARDTVCTHAQDIAMSDELLLAILKAFAPRMNKQQGFHVFTYTLHI